MQAFGISNTIAYTNSKTELKVGFFLSFQYWNDLHIVMYCIEYVLYSDKMATIKCSVIVSELIIIKFFVMWTSELLFLFHILHYTINVDKKKYMK